MTDIRPEVVSLLIDVKDLTEFRLGRLTHEDGRPFTAEEFDLVGSATAAEMRACADYSARVSAMYAENLRDAERVLEITQPYVDRFGEEATIGFIRTQVTPEEDAELEAIFERTAPDGYIVY